MTTDQIRKNVTVNKFHVSTDGIFITYINKPIGIATYELTLNLNKFQSAIALERIGSINKFEANPHLRIWWDSPKGAALDAYWEQFCTTFTLSQYEAITLVVRHEYEQSLQSDMNLLEIDKALEALR